MMLQVKRNEHRRTKKTRSIEIFQWRVEQEKGREAIVIGIVVRCELFVFSHVLTCMVSRCPVWCVVRRRNVDHGLMKVRFGEKLMSVLHIYRWLPEISWPSRKRRASILQFREESTSNASLNYLDPYSIDLDVILFGISSFGVVATLIVKFIDERYFQGVLFISR
jgi:hypothetical protein